MKYLIYTLVFFTPLLTFAQVQTFQTLPGLQNAGNLTTQQYIDALYVIAIAAASILAVLKLMWAGAQYMLSEVVTNKQRAKDDIRGALLGLLIILAAVTILNTINPNLTKIDFLRNAQPAHSVPPNTTGSTQKEGNSTDVSSYKANGTCGDGKEPTPILDEAQNQTLICK